MATDSEGSLPARPGQSQDGAARRLTTPIHSQGQRKLRMTDVLLAVVALALIIAAIALWLTGVVTKN